MHTRAISVSVLLRVGYIFQKGAFSYFSSPQRLYTQVPNIASTGCNNRPIFLAGNGYIPTTCLREILRELDDQLTDKELDMMIEEIDTDGSGTVDFDGMALRQS